MIRRSGGRRFRWLLLAGPFVLAAGQDEVVGPEFTRFELSRERVRNRITIEATLASRLSVDLDGVRVTVTYYDGDREIKRSQTAHVARLASGKPSPLVIETEHVEKFDRFEVLVESGDRRFLYEGKDLTRPPTLLKSPPARLEVAALAEARPSRFPGDVVLTVPVRNTGVVAAREPVLVLSFLGGTGAAVHAARVRLAGSLDVATEDTYEVTVPRCPEYASVRASVACAQVDIPCPQDPLGAVNELEVGRCRLVRLTDGTVRMTGTVRNGLPQAIDRVVVTFKVGTVEHRLAVPEPLRAGALRPFEIYVPGCKKVDGYSYTVSFSEAGPVKDGPPEAATAARRKDSRRLSGSEAGGRGPDKATVALRGVSWLKGPPVPGRKLGVDVAFLKLSIRDRNGRPFHPQASLTATLREGQNPPVNATRAVKEESWGRDVEDFRPNKASADGVAYDPLAGELYVGLLRSEKPGGPFRADVTFRIEGVGTWEWKDLGEPFQSEARAPDRK